MEHGEIKIMQVETLNSYYGQYWHMKARLNKLLFAYNALKYQNFGRFYSIYIFRYRIIIGPELIIKIKSDKLDLVCINSWMTLTFVLTKGRG